ncbi:hypothetical protein GpartN1_g7705.t1 [Galdieria partita]|uniref:Beta-amylase n=1 Tax=Galdieria partita TaxID=83374 RepID=A0A9C7Q424_9RHOD|nr:hypothetical protein GpartN1_g7705.t1 [Galdieria partita]
MWRKWFKTLWTDVHGETRVYVMCPLNSAFLPLNVLAWQFDQLVKVGVEGIMLDVWWSLCEPTPGCYDFSSYRPILQLAIERGLKIQAVLSFHTCGESEGDQVVISLPPFVRQLTTEHEFIFYTDEDGQKSFECLSLSADHAQVFPCFEGVRLRTALEMYEDFMRAFYVQFSEWLGTHIVQIQVSMGPSGELRYPSFALSRWKFPGMGAFQCYDQLMQQDYLHYITSNDDTQIEKDHPLFPCYKTCGTGYNEMPWQTLFFAEPKGIAETTAGKIFLKWYSNKLLSHGEHILERAHHIFHNHVDSSKVEIACKIAGIHWFYRTPYRAAEAIAGYYVSHDFHFYQQLALLLKKYHATWVFTCFEKRDEWEDKLAMCSPESLVRETWAIAANHSISYSAENGKTGKLFSWTSYLTNGIHIILALELEKSEEYEEVIRKADWGRRKGYDLSYFTLLRLSEELVQEPNHRSRLAQFVNRMRKTR